MSAASSPMADPPLSHWQAPRGPLGLPSAELPATAEQVVIGGGLLPPSFGGDPGTDRPPTIGPGMAPGGVAGPVLGPVHALAPIPLCSRRRAHQGKTRAAADY